MSQKLMSNRCRSGFTLLQLAVLVVCMGVIFSLLLSAGSRRSGHGGQMQNQSRMAGIHKGMFIFAQGNRGYYQGLDSLGNDVDLSVAWRLEVLMVNDFFDGEYIIAPSETKTAIDTGPLTSANYSYALLEIKQTESANDLMMPSPAVQHDGPTPRRDGWRDDSNSLTIVISDRNTGKSDKLKDQQSIWTLDAGNWRGGVTWNDNHVSWETLPDLEETRYGDSRLINDDNLFLKNDGRYEDNSKTPHAMDGAWMIYEGQ